MVEVLLQPVGATELWELTYLRDEVPRHLPIRVSVMPHIWALQPPVEAYSWSRMQYRADIINSWLADQLRPLLAPYRLVLGVVNADGYIEGLNFVFGLADPRARVATVYTARLRASYSVDLYRQRLLKETLHELGHLFGLDHCNDPHCVMSFSNSLDDVDRKGSDFCPRCSMRLRQLEAQGFR